MSWFPGHFFTAWIIVGTIVRDLSILKWKSISPKNHILKIPIFTKFTFLKSQLSQKSHIWNLNFHKIHVPKISIFSKVKIHIFWNLIFHKIHIFEISKWKEFLDIKLVFALVWDAWFTKLTYTWSKFQVENMILASLLSYGLIIWTNCGIW